MRYFYVEPSQVVDSKAVLEGSEASHLKNVMRLKRGDVVGLVDGSGWEYAAVIDRIVPGRVELSITGRKQSAGMAPFHIHAAQGFLKEKKMDLIVRQLSELGVARWTPFVCERAVARPETGRAAYRCERWRKIAIEALKQCRRGDLMAIEEITDWEGLVAAGRMYGLRILFWEGAAEPLTIQRLPTGGAGVSSAFVVLGPEGGFSEKEVAEAEAAGFVIASLGPRILRAETAAVAACAIVQHLFGDLGAGQKHLDIK